MGDEWSIGKLQLTCYLVNMHDLSEISYLFADQPSISVFIQYNMPATTVVDGWLATAQVSISPPVESQTCVLPDTSKPTHVSCLLVDEWWFCSHFSRWTSTILRPAQWLWIPLRTSWGTWGNNIPWLLGVLPISHRDISLLTLEFAALTNKCVALGAPTSKVSACP